MEALVRSEVDAEYYWGSGAHEVDFVLKNREILPLEVKYGDKEIKKRDLKGLIKFCGRFQVKKGIIYTRNTEGTYEADGIEIRAEVIPKALLYSPLITAP